MNFTRMGMLRAVSTAVALAVLAGCSSAPIGSPSVTTSNPVFAQSTAPPQATALGETTSLLTQTSAVVDGAVGGIVNLGDWTVNVPAGAYPGSATITIKVPDPTVAKCDLGISPASANAFKVQVLLSCRLRTTAEVLADDMMWWDPSVSKWRVISSSPSPATMSRVAPLWHFSSYSCGRAGW